MANVRWEKHHQVVLIERVKERTCLWDIRHPHYRNTHRKQTLFEEIASEMVALRPGTTVEDVKKRWGNLRCQFSENIRVSKSKDGGPEKYKRLWCKANLMFLMDVTIPRVPRKRISCVESDEASNADADESMSEEMDPRELEPNEGMPILRVEAVPENHQKISELPLDPLTLDAPSSPSQMPQLQSLPNDAIEKYALCVASELRLIRQPQQLVLAKWHIQNVLFQAQFGMLAGPPATLAFSSTPANCSQDWSETPPTHVISSEGDCSS